MASQGSSADQATHERTPLLRDDESISQTNESPLDDAQTEISARASRTRAQIRKSLRIGIFTTLTVSILTAAFGIANLILLSEGHDNFGVGHYELDNSRGPLLFGVCLSILKSLFN